MSSKTRKDPATEAFEAGEQLLQQHALFAALRPHINLYRGVENNECPSLGWAVVYANGTLHIHPKRRATPEQWCYVLAHSLLHLGFGHFSTTRAHPREWNLACDLVIARFLHDLKFGQPPPEWNIPDPLPPGSEEELYRGLLDRQLHVVANFPADLGVGGPVRWRSRSMYEWEKLFAACLRKAVHSVVDAAAGALTPVKPISVALQQARSWFVSAYPLLGALATAFELVEDAELCKAHDIRIAAVDFEERRIYFNPHSTLTTRELRFVMAHELLHVGLSHGVRCQGRDPFLWNVACDYVINGWLQEMDIGDLPAFGCLYDPELKGLSAEAVYDLIVRDLRRYRKCMTFAGTQGDILRPKTPAWWAADQGTTLDEFYRSCLAQGCALHREKGRGLLPAGLLAEIQSLQQPPIPWDVQLAQWFDHHFAPREFSRTYARASRRQSSTPDIPRPRTVPQARQAAQLLAVLLDTSGSMSPELLGKALGSVASYSAAREVDAIRLVFCDAATYDQGYVQPEDLAGHVKVRGRGGTILQPALDLLDADSTLPERTPVLIITDAACDIIRVRREHAYLTPANAVLPFPPRGPQFRVK